MNISTNKLSHIIFIFITLASLTIMISCSSEEEFVVPKEENEQTVIMFFPWSSNLLPYFQQNIKDFSKSIEERGSQNARVMVCLATTPNTADLMELKYDNGSCIVENIITAKPKAHAFKNEMCFPLTKTKCELKKHPNSKFECFFNDFNRTKTSLFLPFPSKLIQDNLVCVLELQE